MERPPYATTYLGKAGYQSNVPTIVPEGFWRLLCNAWVYLDPKAGIPPSQGTLRYLVGFQYLSTILAVAVTSAARVAAQPRSSVRP